MEIRPIEHINDERYQALATSAGTVFNSPAWLAMYGKALGLYGIYSGDQLVAAFFLLIGKKMGLTLHRTPPFTPHIGFVQAPLSKNPSKSLSENKKILSMVADFIDHLPGGLISLSFPSTVNDMQPFVWKKFKVIPHYTYQTDLALTGADPEANLSPEHRNLARKASRDGIICKAVTDYAVVKNLVMKTFDRKNKDLDASMLDKILFSFSNSGNSFAFAGYEQDVPVSVAFCLTDVDHAYYLLGGYDPARKHGGAGILCLMQSMAHARQLQKKIFDFEGSMLPEVERFFRGFGPNLVPYYTVNKALLPIEVFLKFRKRELF